MPTLKLRFVTSNDFISDAIRAMTDCKFSHVEFVLDEDWRTALGNRAQLLIAANLNNWTLGAHLDGGIMLRRIDYATFSAQEIVSIECTVEDKQAAIKAACACIGAGYDVEDIAGIVFKQNWSQKNHYICSVFVAKTLIEAGIHVLRVAPDIAPSITPRDMYLSPLLQRVAA
jgi:hypothetical protein